MAERSEDALSAIEQGHHLATGGFHGGALAFFKQAAALQPGWPMPYNNLAWSADALGRPAEAELNYHRALILNPELEQARINLAVLLSRTGHGATAAPLWEGMLAASGQSPTILGEALFASMRGHELNRAAAFADRLFERERPVADPARPRAGRVTLGKLRHDLEQLYHLSSKLDLDPVLDAYRALFERMTLEGLAEVPLADCAPEIQRYYGNKLYRYAAQRIAEGALRDSAYLRSAEQHYIDSEHGIVVVDDLLTPRALAELQKFCRESTVWNADHYTHERLGSFFREGFNCPLLIQIAEELIGYFPRIIGQEHALLQMWGFKYRHDQPFTAPHADFAAVNVNFWITPDEANRNPQSGGLVIYDKEAPPDWDFDRYNYRGQEIVEFLIENQASEARIPYRCNRAVIFNSDLFHATDVLDFAPDYANRRVNVTMLYGERCAAWGHAQRFRGGKS